MSKFGYFEPDRPNTQWLSDGHSMTLLDDFVYVDPDGVRWTALEGSRIDGSSIPRAFWIFVGSPFTGRHRYASIPHDVYCQTRIRSSVQTHKMYYSALRASGVGRFKAYVMWLAVSTFGPRF